MELTTSQFDLIARYLPQQRGNVKLDNHQVLNTILYVVEQACKWNGLPSKFGNWHTVYTRMNRWVKRGVLDKIFAILQEKNIIQIKV